MLARELMAIAPNSNPYAPPSAIPQCFSLFVKSLFPGFMIVHPLANEGREHRQMLFAGLHDRKHHGDQAWDILTA
jgi:hypothetical protein